ncbi:NADP-dependent phosphogluconate dehydrogenase [Aliihoeflea aestuarii]|uniref:NADP-dependent phosphogluconate dehydrogenase n=1 Tax=Aliihoeflea aestuarii TaxID=453840 RepID=UPI002093DFEF|nr:NADP-dependent phosphogluconate dehydrogenase [Aliihoeflea aestuarii]MCO6391682.1 NADP-dependent phosphogluconate dehydrogenase [Aliihoeflea aestuarii]
MTKAQIGLFGLGTMGSNLALNIAEKGHAVAVYNRTAEKTGTFFENAGDLRERIVPCATLAEFVKQIKPPRPIILMVQAGKAVDEQIAALREHLDAGDMIIDAGNANFRDTIRRYTELEGSGLTFVGMGVSGGEDGARHGPSIMVGGPEEAWIRIQPILEDIAARFHGEPCAAWLGPGGAGHFVKTIHNGIEYADMQMIAEIYGILRDGAGMAPGEIADIFERWNAGPLDSYLVEITATVLRTRDAASGKALVDVIADQAGQKGTGRWAAVEAQLMGVPATTIETAVAARSLSAEKDLRLAAEKAYGAPAAPSITADAAFIDDLENALLAAKVAAYAQGFAVMEEASSEFRWNLPLGMVARIWRAGCIIRSQFLSEIATAYEASAEPAHLLLLPAFMKTMSGASPSLRRVVARAVEAGLPVPALGAAVTYFDAFRQGRGTANLIQGQRDFFGAHGFDRIDGSGEHHGHWLRT